MIQDKKLSNVNYRYTFCPYTDKIWNILDHEWLIGREQLYGRSSSNFSQLHY